MGQYDSMLAQVRAQAPSQKLVLTTTVTDSAVELLEGDRARLLVFADQRNTRTTGKAHDVRGGDARRRRGAQRGAWKISNIDTLNVPR